MYRILLLDKSIKVYSTHGDLTLGSIIVERISGKHKVASIIDSEQSGWYPEHWVSQQEETKHGGQMIRRIRSWKLTKLKT